MNSHAKNNKLMPQQPRNQQASQDTLPDNIVYIFTGFGCIREAWKNPSSGEIFDVLLNDAGEISDIGGYKIEYVDGGTQHAQRNQSQNYRKLNAL